VERHKQQHRRSDVTVGFAVFPLSILDSLTGQAWVNRKCRSGNKSPVMNAGLAMAGWLCCVPGFTHALIPCVLLLVGQIVQPRDVLRSTNPIGRD
jgi:integral membrane sensor domain MASE1